MTTIAQARAEFGYQLDEDAGEAFWLLGMLQTIKIGGDDTAGQYGLIEIVVPAGIGSPWHVHPEEDEWFYVLEGEMTFWVADSRLSLQAGSFAFGPKGVPHTFYAEGTGARALVGFAPMQFEGFLREVGEPAPERVLPPPLEAHPDLERLIAIGKRNGLEILGPPGPPPDDDDAQDHADRRRAKRAPPSRRRSGMRAPSDSRASPKAHRRANHLWGKPRSGPAPHAAANGAASQWRIASASSATPVSSRSGTSWLPSAAHASNAGGRPRTGSARIAIAA